MYWFGRYLTYISCSSDFYTFYIDIPLSLGCIIRKVNAEDTWIAIRGNGTGLDYICPTRHFVYIFFNPVFQLSTAKNEVNLFNNHDLIVAPVTFVPASVTTPSAEFLLCLAPVVVSSMSDCRCRGRKFESQLDNTLLWWLIMKRFLLSFYLFRWLKEDSCHFLLKICAQVLVNNLEDKAWPEKDSLAQQTGSTLVLLNKKLPKILIFTQADYLIQIVAVNSHT